MYKYALLESVQRLYKELNVNIIQYLKKITNSNQNSVEDIMISYDFQAGTYVEDYKSNSAWKIKFLSRLVQIFGELPGRKKTVFEAGVGEATTLVPFINALHKDISAGGGDISWSRVKVGQVFAKEYLKPEINSVSLAMTDMFSLPLANDSVDVVYTVHAIEPNGGHEAEILQELYRVANEYLILLEPAYELAGEDARQRMEQNGYVRELYKTAKDLGYDVLTWELYGISQNPLNPTGLMIIRKKPKENAPRNIEFACPLTKDRLEPLGNVYYAKNSLLAYPVLNGVPCLISDYAVVATRLADFI